MKSVKIKYPDVEFFTFVANLFENWAFTDS